MFLVLSTTHSRSVLTETTLSVLKFGVSSRKRPPPVINHLGLKFWGSLTRDYSSKNLKAVHSNNKSFNAMVSTQTFRHVRKRYDTEKCLSFVTPCLS